jgi:endoglucanase
MKGVFLMRKHIKKFLSLFTAGAMSLSALPFISAQAQDVSSMTPKQIAADMGVGWNLGNTLDAHDSGSHKKMGLESETYWGNPKATKALIDAVKAKGFNTIRIPVTWYPHADANYKINSAWMSRVKQVVDWAIADDTYVILNVHHDEWNRPTNANYSAASKELKAFWKQIAAEFQNYDRHLIFEGMNEPRNYGGNHEWDGGTSEMREVVNKLDKDFVDTVRATGGKNKTRCLMIPTYAASSTTAAMKALSIPNDPNILVSIHAYTPYNFTMNTGYGATNVFDSKQESDLKQLFNDISNIYISKGHSVVIGEFSASNKNNTAERVKWAKSYANLAKSKGIPIVLWDNNSINDTYNNGEGHGYINRKTLQWYDASEPVVDALIKTYGHVKATKEKTISNCKITLSQRSYTYDGNEHKPSVTVTFDGKKLTEGKDYSLTYKGGRNVGDASVTVTGTGNFKGSATVKYSVDPADLSGYKLGDVNFDNSINITDITLTSAHVKGKSIMSASRIKAADINRDGKINITDITRIAAQVKGKKLLPNEKVA